MSMTTKASNMKYGWYQMINNTANYYQTPYNIALIVHQLSNYNSLLREQIKTEEDALIKQKHKISDKKRHASKLCESATEYVRKRMEKRVQEMIEK